MKMLRVKLKTILLFGAFLLSLQGLDAAIKICDAIEKLAALEARLNDFGVRVGQRLITRIDASDVIETSPKFSKPPIPSKSVAFAEIKAALGTAEAVVQKNIQKDLLEQDACETFVHICTEKRVVLTGDVEYSRLAEGFGHFAVSAHKAGLEVKVDTHLSDTFFLRQQQNFEKLSKKGYSEANFFDDVATIMEHQPEPSISKGFHDQFRNEGTTSGLQGNIRTAAFLCKNKLEGEEVQAVDPDLDPKYPELKDAGVDILTNKRVIQNGETTNTIRRNKLKAATPFEAEVPAAALVDLEKKTGRKFAYSFQEGDIGDLFTPSPNDNLSVVDRFNEALTKVCATKGITPPRQLTRDDFIYVPWDKR